MWPLEETASLNNEGVRLFEDGTFLEAIGYFQLCFDQITEYQLDQQFKDENENTISAGEAANVSVETTTTTSTTPTIGPSNPFNGWSKPSKQPEMEADSPFLLARVLRIRHQEQESMEAHFLHSYKAALYYNLAVTHQVLLRQPRDGVELPVFACTSTTSTAMMLFRLYETAYLEYKAATSSSSSDDNDAQTYHHTLLCLALFNNMGVVFLSEIAQFRQASECFKAACGVMCGLMKDSNGDSDDNRSEVLEGGEIYEMSLNGFLVPSEACPAA